MDCLIMTYRARSRPFEKEECQLRFLRIKGVLEIFCYFYTWKWHFSKKHPPSLDLPLWFAIIIHELRIHCYVSNFCWCHGFPRNGIHYCAPYNKFRLLSHLTYFLKYMILKSVYHNVYKIFVKDRIIVQNWIDVKVCLFLTSVWIDIRVYLFLTSVWMDIKVCLFLTRVWIDAIAGSDYFICHTLYNKNVLFLKAVMFSSPNGTRVNLFRYSLNYLMKMV